MINIFDIKSFTSTNDYIIVEFNDNDKLAIEIDDLLDNSKLLVDVINLFALMKSKLNDELIETDFLLIQIIRDLLNCMLEESIK